MLCNKIYCSEKNEFYIHSNIFYYSAYINLYKKNIFIAFFSCKHKYKFIYNVYGH